MPMRIAITRLRDNDLTEPDVFGRHVTINVPDDLPALADCHRTLTALAAQAPLYIAIMSAARVLVPDPPKPPGKHSRTKPTAA